MVMPPLRPVAVAPPLPSPFASGRIRGRRLETHPHAKPREAPIAAWADQFKTSGLTEEEMRTALTNRRAARRCGWQFEEDEQLRKQKAEEAELCKQRWKQKVRTPRRSCAALLQRLSGPPRFAV